MKNIYLILNANYKLLPFQDSFVEEEKRKLIIKKIKKYKYKYQFTKNLNTIYNEIIDNQDIKYVFIIDFLHIAKNINDLISFVIKLETSKKNLIFINTNDSPNLPKIIQNNEYICNHKISSKVLQNHREEFSIYFKKEQIIRGNKKRAAKKKPLGRLKGQPVKSKYDKHKNYIILLKKKGYTSQQILDKLYNERSFIGSKNGLNHFIRTHCKSQL